LGSKNKGDAGLRGAPRHRDTGTAMVLSAGEVAGKPAGAARRAAAQEFFVWRAVDGAANGEGASPCRATLGYEVLAGCRGNPSLQGPSSGER
jgi:hypothetical protein